MHSQTFLPTDENIFERSKFWSNFLSRIVEEEKFADFSYSRIPSECEDFDENEPEANENKPNNNNALVKAVKFEATSSSDELDMDDLVNETIPVIEERKRKWKESGMDTVLDTFDLETITDKVGSWLKTTKLDKSEPSNSSMEDEQIVHYENHQIHFNSDDSLQSADTAKYILSNRKPRTASCTTMTIKRFRYVKGKQKELQRKYSYDVDEDLDRICNSRCAKCEPTVTSRIMGRAKSRTPDNCLVSLHKKVTKSKQFLGFLMTQHKDEEKSKREVVRTVKSRPRKRRSNTSRKRSVSSSSSNSSNCSTPHTRDRYVRKSNKNKYLYANTSHTTTTTTTTDYNVSSGKISPPVKRTQVTKVPKPAANIKSLKTAQNSNVTCFLPEGIVNSTALSIAEPLTTTKTCQLSPISKKERPEKKLVIKLKKIDAEIKKMTGNSASTKTCQLSPISSKTQSETRLGTKLTKQVTEDNTKTAKSVIPKPSQTRQRRPETRLSIKLKKICTENEVKKKPYEDKNDNQSPACGALGTTISDRNIVVYTPKNQSMHRKSISNGRFRLTEEHLRKSIGERAARRFIKFNASQFPWEFDSSSIVYFKLPSESENSHRSGSSGDSDEEDILNMFGKQGKLIEQPMD